MQSTGYSYSENIIDLGTSVSLGSSSSSSHYYSARNTHKRQKLDRACDACRRRKSKCDGPTMQDNVCTNCRQTKKSCTYLEGSKPRGPPKAYVTGLEDRMGKLEALLNELQPDADFSSELGPPVIRGSWNLQDSTATSSFEHQRPHPSLSLKFPTATQSASKTNATLTFSQSAPVGRSTHLIFDSQPTNRRRMRSRQPFSGEDSDNESSSCDDSTASGTLEIESLTGLVKKLSLSGTGVNEDIPIHQNDDTAHQNNRFHGNCSPVDLVEATRQFKLMHLLEMTQRSGPQQSPASQPSMDVPLVGGLALRLDLWRTPYWEHAWEVHGFETADLFSSALAGFPPADLAEELINLYFRHSNYLIPLLHYDTFVQQWREKLFHKNIWFATVCLFLFAVASRWTNDPRVIKEGARTTIGDPIWAHAGLGYFEKGVEIHRVRRSLFYPATLLEIQSLTLMALYLSGTDNYPAAWLMISVAIGKVQDVGAHRKNVYRSTTIVDKELWKRTFWCLLVLDRLTSVIIGRGCSVGEEDFDVDLPLEVDDQYWEADDPALAFQQPAGIPSRVCAFTFLIKLSQIMAFALRSVHVIDPSKIFPGPKFVNWRKEVFEQLNSAMSEWVASLPDHLKWPPQTDNLGFIPQAAILQMLYNLIRMLIYRPFSCSTTKAPLSSSDKDASSFPYPAMDICIEAARSCARIVEVLIEHRLLNVPILMHAAHLSATMLLVKVWNLKAEERRLQAQGIENFKPSFDQQIEPFLADVNILIQILEWAEPRWPFVSLFLYQLRESLPSPGDHLSPNATEGSSCSTNPCPATPPPLPQYITVQLPAPEEEIMPLNQFWQWESHPIKIQPARSAYYTHPLAVQAHSQYLNPHIPGSHPFITQEYSPLSRSVEERPEAQQVQSCSSKEVVSRPPSSHRTVGATSDVPSSSAPANRPVPYPSRATRTAAFTAYGGGEPGDSRSNRRSAYPNPRIEDPRSTSSQLETAFHMRGDV